MIPGASPVPPVCVDNRSLLLSEESQIYNIRKLKELPYCLAKCGRNEELKHLLLDYDWVKACTSAISCADLISDFDLVVPVVSFGKLVM